MNQNFDNNQNFNPQNNQGFAPNQAQGQGFAPNFAPPIDPRIAEGEKKAENSKLMGIIGLIVGVLCCGLIGVVLEIISFVMAKKSIDLLGYEHPDAKTGKICALIGLILAIIRIVVIIIYILLFILGVIVETNIAY